MSTPERPSFDNLADMLTFLDVMKAEGKVGFGVTERIERQFRIEAHEAAQVVQYWIATYGTAGPR
jgi:hypothetical protein